MDDPQTTNTVAPLRNVVGLATLITRVKDRAGHLPGMAVFYGPSGFGKTMATVYCALKYRAISVQVKSVWSKKTLCEAILAEIGVPADHTVSRMLDQISQHLAITGLPLLIDEADFLVQRKMVEIVRDIYEGSGAPVILIGEELLPQKLKAWERVHGRILDWVPAQPADGADLDHLARIYVPGVQLSGDLREMILKASMGSARRICVNLDRVREHALVKGLMTVSANDWADRAFFTGTAPEIRQFGAARKGAV